MKKTILRTALHSTALAVLIAVGCGDNSVQNKSPKVGDFLTAFRDAVSNTATPPDTAQTPNAGTYTVTVVAGDGAKGGGEYPPYASVTVTAGTPPNGSKFNEWMSSDDNVIFIPGANSSTVMFSMPTNSVTLTADFEKIPEAPKYTVTVSAGNNATGGGEYPAGDTVAVTAGTPPSERQFKEWTSSVSGLDFIPSANNEEVKFIMPAGAVTVTAGFEAIAEAAKLITFIAGGGATVSPGNRYTNADGKLETLPVPERNGYSFGGWFTAENGGNEVIAGTTVFNTDDYIYAHWTITPYTIEYHLDNGSPGLPANPTNYTIMTDNITLSNPTKTGYTFVGWTEAGDAIQKMYTTVTIETGSTTGNKSYTANWIPIAYTITYNLDGGTVAAANPNPTSYTIETKTFLLNNPTKTGNTFNGWTGANGQTPEQTVSIALGSTGNRTYTANWTAESVPTTFTLTIKSNPTVGGSVTANNNSAGTQNISAGTAVTISATASSGYTFNNWTPDGVTLSNANSQTATFTMPANAVTVTANFQQQPTTPNTDTDAEACLQTTALSNPARTITANGMGTLSGSGTTQIHYEIWTEGGNNKLSWYGADKGGGAAFKAEWANNPNDYLGRVGFYWGNGQAYTAYKNIYVDFNYKGRKSGSGGSYSFIGIHGWARNPSASDNNRKLIEYFIIDDWFGSGQISTGLIGGSKVGEYTIDGGTYFVITNIRQSAPSIDGTKTYTQYYSIRQGMGANARQCGTYSVTEHFKQWADLNLNLGNMYDCKFLVEVGGGTGSVDLSYLKFSQEDTPRGSVPTGNFTLKTIASPEAGGTVTKSPNYTSYSPGDNVNVTAVAASGWKFDSWSGDASGTTNPVTITMNANKIVTANFLPIADPTTNLVKNGTFTSTSDWNLYNWDNSRGTLTVSGGNANITITALPSGSDAGVHSLQLVQNGIQLVQRVKYRVSFDASAASARSIGLVMQMDTEPWTGYFEKNDVNLTTTKTAFTYTFEMVAASDANARIAFNFGNATPSVTISNVKLGYVTD